VRTLLLLEEIDIVDTPDDDPPVAPPAFVAAPPQPSPCPMQPAPAGFALPLASATLAVMDVSGKTSDGLRGPHPGGAPYPNA